MRIRHKLIPTRRDIGLGWFPSWFVDGREAALTSAMEFYETEGATVLVIEAPEDRLLLRPVTIVGEVEEKAKAKALAAERAARRAA